MIPRDGGSDDAGRIPKRAVSVALSKTGLTDKTSLLSVGDNADGQNDPKRAQTLDGAFFEAFATVDKKQRGFLKQAKADSKRQAETLVEKQEADASSVLHPYFSKDKFTHDQGKLMYQELLYVVNNQLGKRKVGSDEISPGDLIVYGQKAFGISREEHKELYLQVKERKPPKTFVVVTVVEAKGLEAKDANGFSDPYCMLGVLKDTQGRKISKDGKKTKTLVLRDIQDEHHVQLTKIKDRTLNPVWNEQFSLEVNNIDSEIVRIDVWDKDDASVFLDEDNRITAIKGFSGFSRFLKEVASSAKCDMKSTDDFLGLVEIYIRDIPSEGMEQEFDLEPRSKRSHVQGSLKVKVRLTAVQEEHQKFDDASIASPMSFQRQLLKWFIKHDYEDFFDSEDARNGPWSMKLSKLADFLFHQFAIQNSLSPYQEAIVRWEVYASCIQEVTIPIDRLEELIDLIRTFGNRDDLSNDETMVFTNSLDNFLVYSMQLIRRHQIIFPPTLNEQCLRLGKLLLCMLNLYRLPLFVAAFPDRRLPAELESELKASTKVWFDVTVAYNEALERNDDAHIASLVKVTNSLTVFLKAAKKTYITLFKVIRIDYYSLVYTELDALLTAKVQPILYQVTEQVEYGKEDHCSTTSIFELYVSLKTFQDMKKVIPDEDRLEGPIDNFHKWFEVGVHNWLGLAKSKSIKRIKKAVELDEVRVVEGSRLMHSQSAVDVTWCLSQICVFWSRLQWPDIDGVYVFLTQIANIITSCATEYADIVLDMLRKVDYYEGQGAEFDINEKLCVTMNNLEHVLDFLDTIPEVLDFESVLIGLSKKYGESRLQNLRDTLDCIMDGAKEDMRQRLDQIIVKTGERMKGEIIKKLYHVCNAAMEEDDPYELADGVLSYIDSNLITLSNCLLAPAFDRCLINVWEVFLFGMEEVVRSTSRRYPKVFSALRQVLHIAQEFFSGDGQGISGELRTMHPFKSLDKLLLLYELQSGRIIENYYIEKCEEQGRTDEAFGAIAFKIFYSQENNALHVEVSSVRDLLPLDSNQLADPYVQLELLPKHTFKGIPEKRTGVQHSTLFAIIDEKFSFDVSKEACQQRGAALNMTVWDRDRFYEDDIAGEVFVDLSRILGLEDNITASFFFHSTS